ncbi:hypothetical protein [Leptolyngbya sp. BC1307]|nr:hypothetical protein [Leptolyngbya sp. BC1307]
MRNGELAEAQGGVIAVLDSPLALFHRIGSARAHLVLGDQMQI